MKSKIILFFAIAAISMSLSSCFYRGHDDHHHHHHGYDRDHHDGDHHDR